VVSAVGILDSCNRDGALLLAVKDKLWQYKLYDIMLTALKQDFNRILDGWNTAAKVAHILVYVCSSKNSLVRYYICND